MKVNKKNIEKNIEKKSNFSLKSLLILLFAVFIVSSMATSLVATIARTTKAITSNNSVQNQLKNTQTAVTEQNKKIDGLKSAEGAEANGRADGMVKPGEVPVQIQFAPGGNNGDEAVADDPPLFNLMNGLIGLLLAISAILGFYLIKKRRISLRLVEPPVVETNGLQPRNPK